MRWAGHIALMKEVGYTCNIFIGKLEEERSRERARR
jgi:hypothetical protein